MERVLTEASKKNTPNGILNKSPWIEFLTALRKREEMDPSTLGSSWFKEKEGKLALSKLWNSSNEGISGLSLI